MKFDEGYLVMVFEEYQFDRIRRGIWRRVSDEEYQTKSMKSIRVKGFEDCNLQWKHKHDGKSGKHQQIF